MFNSSNALADVNPLLGIVSRSLGKLVLLLWLFDFCPTTEPQKHRRPHSHDNLLDSELVKVPASIATETLVYRKLDILLFSQLSSGHEDMLLGLYQIKQTLAHPPGRINKPIRTSFLCNPHGSGLHCGKKGLM